MIVTYAAHNNCIEIRSDYLSCDYAGGLVDSLQKNKTVDFAAFCAGAVGSMAPNSYNQSISGQKQAVFISDRLSEMISTHKDSLRYEQPSTVMSFYIPLLLRDPHLKISKDLRISPWFFFTLFGDYKPGISVLKLGDIVMMGMPCDFSGELVKSIEQVSADKHEHLLITSFNGGYVGYINNDAYYDHSNSETRYMNWFGPENGAYFSEVMKDILKKL